MSGSGVIFLVIVVLVIAALACGRAGSSGGALTFGGLALLLVVATPLGAGLPGTAMDAVRGVGDFGGPVLEGNPPEALHGPAELLARPLELMGQQFDEAVGGEDR